MRFPVNILKFLKIAFLQNTSAGCFWRGVIQLLFKNFVFWGKFMNFLIWKVYPSMVIHHEQCIFMYVLTQLAVREKIFHNLSKFYHVYFNSSLLKIRSLTCCGWLGQHGPCCNTNTRPSLLNTRLSFWNTLLTVT